MNPSLPPQSLRRNLPCTANIQTKQQYNNKSSEVRMQSTRGSTTAIKIMERALVDQAVALCISLQCFDTDPRFKSIYCSKSINYNLQQSFFSLVSVLECKHKCDGTFRNRRLFRWITWLYVWHWRRTIKGKTTASRRVYKSAFSEYINLPKLADDYKS